MARGMVVALALLAVLGTGTVARAQDEGVAAPVVVRTEPGLASLGAPIALGVARRSGRTVTLGEMLDATEPRDLGADVIGIARIGPRLRMFAIAPSGALHVTEVGSASDDAATIRVLVVALASFLEALEADVAREVAADAPPPTVFESYGLPTDGSALEDLDRPYQPLRFDPGFVMELRERIGYATQRDYALPATGGSLGVCFGTWWCLVIEADVMLPDESHAIARGGVAYRSTTLGIGGRFLPLEAGPVRGGVGIDALTRIGELSTDSPPAYSVTVSAGMRLLFDVSVTLGGPVSLVLQGGADIAFNAVHFFHLGALAFAEDIATLWASLGLRIGPL